LFRSGFVTILSIRIRQPTDPDRRPSALIATKTVRGPAPSEWPFRRRPTEFVCLIVPINRFVRADGGMQNRIISPNKTKLFVKINGNESNESNFNLNVGNNVRSNINIDGYGRRRGRIGYNRRLLAAIQRPPSPNRIIIKAGFRKQNKINNQQTENEPFEAVGRRWR
jgi:hypothetical protein